MITLISTIYSNNLLIGGVGLLGVIGTKISTNLFLKVEEVVYDIEEKDDAQPWKVYAVLVSGIALSLFIGIVSALFIGGSFSFSITKLSGDSVLGVIVGAVTAATLNLGLVFKMIDRFQEDVNPIA